MSTTKDDTQNDDPPLLDLPAGEIADFGENYEDASSAVKVLENLSPRIETGGGLLDDCSEGNEFVANDEPAIPVPDENDPPEGGYGYDCENIEGAQLDQTNGDYEAAPLYAAGNEENQDEEPLIPEPNGDEEPLVAESDENLNEEQNEDEEVPEPQPIDIECLSDFDPAASAEQNAIQVLECDIGNGVGETTQGEPAGNSSSPTIEAKEELTVKEYKKVVSHGAVPGPAAFATNGMNLESKARQRIHRHCVFQHLLAENHTLVPCVAPLEVPQCKSKGFRFLLGHFNAIRSPQHYCPYSSMVAVHTKHPETEKRIGPLTISERKQKIQKYREKRARRRWNHKIMYSCRKVTALKKPRINGRFVSREKFPHACSPKTASRMGLNRELPVILEPVFEMTKVKLKQAPASHKSHHVAFG